MVPFTTNVRGQHHDTRPAFLQTASGEPDVVGCCTPVIPENPNLLQSLTFSSYDLTLDQCIFAPADALWEASDATTCHLCPVCLRHRFLPITGLTTPRKSRATASDCRVQADDPSPLPPPV